MNIINLKQYFCVLAAAQNERVSGSILIVTAIFVGLMVGSLAVYIQIDYRRHRRPLKEIDPQVHYSHIHHVQVVVLPMAKFRVHGFIHRIFHRTPY